MQMILTNKQDDATFAMHNDTVTADGEECEKLSICHLCVYNLKNING